jgi:hypothetical protein
MGLGTVDLLSIDTEGNAINVISGAINFLTSHLVRVLKFEVHGINHWDVSRVGNVVALLDTLASVCFLASPCRIPTSYWLHGRRIQDFGRLVLVQYGLRKC